jgi:nucleotide-binding universal stress UspA family protein
MIKFKQILCPTNLTTESDEGLRYGLALAGAYGAKLELLYCGTGAEATVEFSGTAQTKNYFGDSIAPHLAACIDGRPEWEGIVVESLEEPGEGIVRVAAERSVDLIVMRSRRRPRAAALLGSTAERVYRTAPCPVLITHPREREWVSPTTGEIALERVLVAHDFSNDSELAVQYALSLAQEYQAELHLLHVLRRPETDGPEIAWGLTGREAVYNAAARRLQEATPDEAGLWSTIVRAVRWGKPYQETLAYAHEHEIDLICMGAKGGNFGLGALFGSNVDRVLRQAPCPVLVARPLRPSFSESLSAGNDLIGTARR